MIEDITHFPSLGCLNEYNLLDFGNRFPYRVVTQYIHFLSMDNHERHPLPSIILT